MRVSRLSLAGLLLLLSLLAVPGAASAAPALTVAPAVGPAGTIFAVRGTGFAADRELTAYTTNAAGQPVASTTVRTDGGGAFNTTYTTSGGTPPGTYTAIIAALGTQSPALASAQFTVTVPTGERHFPETGHTVRGRFLEYWEANGGLARNGFPLSDERREVLEDGREYTVQYFERVRLELHPENARPYDVLLGQFGRRVLRDRFGVDQVAHREATKPAAPVAGAAYFAESGHNLGGAFLAYWQANGGLAQFGYPLTEEFDEWGLLPERGLRVQYFERARLEYHPDNAGTPYEVLLGQFGRQILADVDLLRSGPTDAFHRLYIADEGLHGRLGRPVSPVLTVPGATLAFEQGLMFYRGDSRRIFVLCGLPGAGPLIVSGRYGEVQSPSFADTWAEGQAPGGGPAPRPNLYEPGRGFGKVWHEHADVRDCLGYATSATETGYTMTVQDFERGLLIAAPGGERIYALSYYTTKSHGLLGSYTLHAAPRP